MPEILNPAGAAVDMLDPAAIERAALLCSHGPRGTYSAAEIMREACNLWPNGVPVDISADVLAQLGSFDRRAIQAACTGSTVRYGLTIGARLTSGQCETLRRNYPGHYVASVDILTVRSHGPGARWGTAAVELRPMILGGRRYGVTLGYSGRILAATRTPIRRAR